MSSEATGSGEAAQGSPGDGGSRVRQPRRLLRSVSGDAAEVQVNLDFSSEADMVDTMRLGIALQPIATALFANSPFRDGKPTGYLSWRSHVWTDTDPDRCVSSTDVIWCDHPRVLEGLRAAVFASGSSSALMRSGHQTMQTQRPSLHPSARLLTRSRADTLPRASNRCLAAGVASCHLCLMKTSASHGTWSMRSTCPCILCTGAQPRRWSCQAPSVCSHEDKCDAAAPTLPT